MKPYIVLYHSPELEIADPPLAFACQADDREHAEEQCWNAYPDAVVVWIAQTDDLKIAYEDYWS